MTRSHVPDATTFGPAERVADHAPSASTGLLVPSTRPPSLTVASISVSSGTDGAATLEDQIDNPVQVQDEMGSSWEEIIGSWLGTSALAPECVRSGWPEHLITV
jgi:hypothetical protein